MMYIAGKHCVYKSLFNRREVQSIFLHIVPYFPAKSFEPRTQVRLVQLANEASSLSSLKLVQQFQNSSEDPAHKRNKQVG